MISIIMPAWIEVLFKSTIKFDWNTNIDWTHFLLVNLQTFFSLNIFLNIDWNAILPKYTIKDIYYNYVFTYLNTETTWIYSYLANIL